MSLTSKAGRQVLDYYETLFNHDEHICVAYNAKGRDVHSIQSVLLLKDYEDLQYICVNPLTERRLDENVTAYRNFLFENDSGLSKAEQARIIKDSGLPYSAIVWSGNKSLHVIVSLETPLADRGLYDFVWMWIYSILNSHAPTDKPFDVKTKNPSRFSRVPFGTNVKYDSKGNEVHRGLQDLIKVKGRTPDDMMNDWLMAHPDHKPIVKKYDSTVPLDDMAHPDWLNPWTTYLLENGVYEGKRNDSFHGMAYDFIECGFECEQALAYVADHAKHLNGFPMSEIETTFRSAYKRRGRTRVEAASRND